MGYSLYLIYEERWKVNGALRNPVAVACRAKAECLNDNWPHLKRVR
jgi:hypothetical protein